MAQIENERVAETFGPKKEGLGIPEGVVKSFLDVEGLVEIVEYLGPLGLQVPFIQDNGLGNP
jgi:hypothetical protein